jgi:lipopolysaccharide export system protein LptA
MLSLSATAFALPSDRKQHFSLFAYKATYSEATGVTTYTGNVIIEQGTMKLQASSIVAQLNKSKQISTITATGGPAKFQQQVDSAKGVARGEAQKIVYNAETGIINLIGNAYLYQDGASIRSSTLKYSMNKGDVEASGSSNTTGLSKGRVQIIIPPNSAKSFPGARD